MIDAILYFIVYLTVLIVIVGFVKGGTHRKLVIRSLMVILPIMAILFIHILASDFRPLWRIIMIIVVLANLSTVGIFWIFNRRFRNWLDVKEG